MVRKLLITAIVSVIGSISASAHAASILQPIVSVDVQEGEPKGVNRADAESMLQNVRPSLEKAGLNDVQLLQNSFPVQAKDAAGNTVLIVIGPDSISAMTAPAGQAQCEPSTTEAPPEEIE
jgi:hypothetical protein